MKTFLRIICITVILALSLPALSAKAESEIIFVSVNNDFLALSESTMPVKRGGAVYIPYSIFTSIAGLHSSYNSAEKVLVLFNWDYTMTFNISTGYTYDESGTTYQNPAIEHNGTIYVSASEVADKFEIYCSVINTVEGTLVRINKDTPALSDIMFIYFAESIMRDMKNKFNNPPQDPAPASQITPTQSGTSDTPAEKKLKTIYLTFDNCTASGTESILNTLDKYNYKAAFFVSGSFAADNGALIRAIAAKGHTLGISAYDLNNTSGFYSDSEQMLSELSKSNIIIDKNIKTKTRLVRTPGGSKGKLTSEMKSALSKNGYRLWDWDIRISSAKSSQSLASSVISALEKREADSCVLSLNCNELTSRALNKILTHLKSGNYDVRLIAEWQTPVNFYKLTK